MTSGIKKRPIIPDRTGSIATLERPMDIKRHRFWIEQLSNVQMLIALGLLGVAVLTGCGESESKLSRGMKRAFDAAPAELKQTWERGLQANAINDYFTAYMTFLGLSREQLSPQQTESVRAAMVGLNQRMYRAANKGNDAAKKAVARLQAASQGRRLRAQ